MDTFYTCEELKQLGLGKCGRHVRISRNAVIYSPELLTAGDNVRIDDFVTISGRVSLGNYVHIAQGCGLYGGQQGIFMEDFSGLSARVLVYAESNDYSGEHMTNPTVPDEYSGDIESKVVLGRHAVAGCASVILPGASMGEGSALGAMSLAVKQLDAWGIYAGIPARRIKERKKTVLEKERQLLFQKKQDTGDKRKVLEIGMKESVSRRITQKDIEEYADVTGDRNPIHLDGQAGRESVFGRCIAHGMISGGMISSVIGNKLPGKGTIYLEQNLKFRAPVFAGDACTASVSVSEVINNVKGIYKLDTIVSKQDGSIVTEGYAVVKVKG